MKKSTLKSLIRETVREIQGEDPMKKYKEDPLYKKLQSRSSHKDNQEKMAQSIIGKTVKSVDNSYYDGIITIEFTDGTHISIFSAVNDTLNINAH
jgi:hypothetical protein